MVGRNPSSCNSSEIITVTLAKSVSRSGLAGRVTTKLLVLQVRGTSGLLRTQQWVQMTWL